MLDALIMGALSRFNVTLTDRKARREAGMAVKATKAVSEAQERVPKPSGPSSGQRLRTRLASQYWSL